MNTPAEQLAKLVRIATEARREANANRGNLDLDRAAKRAEKARDDAADAILHPPQVQPSIFEPGA